MIVLLLEDEALIGPALRWPLRIAEVHEDELLVLVPGAPRSKEGQSGAVDVDLSAPTEAAAEMARGLVDALAHHAPTHTGAAVRWVPRERIVEETTARLESPGTDLLILLVHPENPPDERERLRSVLATVTACSFVVVRPGQHETEGAHAVAVATGPHARAAIRMADRVTDATGRDLTALYVQRDLGDELGPEAPRVGRQVLDRLLGYAIEERASRLSRRVEVDDKASRGVLRLLESNGYDAIWVGSSRLGALGARQASVGRRIAKSTEEPTLIAVRNAVSLGNRARRWLDGVLQSRVPQLERTERTSLVERIQATGEWNLDFVLLMSSSAIIAALGLIDDSAAVIIGAMLVAPLMTPLLGLGLAISQENPKLARLALKATSLGFLTAFVLAFLVGLATGDFLQSTPEMQARDWPQLLDLQVAFVAGLAAAYASGRPGLLAALPGVAIAAALLPPVATGGLALSVGDFDLAIGSLLLFAVNMIAIVLASALALWAVGLRRLRHPTRMTRLLGALFVLAAVATAVGMTLAPPRLAPPRALVESVEAALDDTTRLRQIGLRNESRGPVVQIDLGGSTAPDAALAAELLRVTRKHLGKDTDVRLTHRFELLIE